MARQDAALARQDAALARQAAKQHHQAAERLAAKLRELGLDPDVLLR